MYKVENLTFKYDKKMPDNTLSNVSFNLKEGKLNVLLGENGSGKTTIMDCMCGILNSQNSNELPLNKEIVYLTQNLMLSQHSTGENIKNLVKGMCHKSEEKEFDSNILEFVDDSLSVNKKYNHLLGLTTGKMSVGERRWLYILFFAALNRKLYILDEPTSGIDPRTRKMILNRLVNLSKEKIVLISTHQLQDMPKENTHIIFINDGKNIYEGDFIKWMEKMETNDPDIAFEKTIEIYG
ncbi:ATP-binding cassette domain-containing protein [Staphylococcus chromogenes]|uniref:ATP-binding cassette domain-containing protein n=1 Tax=Staphylococcus chromogenes TaxID=46126 RepID=UPI002887BF53|nr:ATP-binding cassette domain-containing protein [Staphylococcus chromogenes]MDT0700353.1 ATP-binding cassette domain-containing protein [Staphylococcus chromogenes]